MKDAEAQFLDALYRGITDDSELKRALEIIQGIFHCRGGALVSLDAQTPSTNLAMISGVFDEYGKLYCEQFAAIDPAPAIFSRLQHGHASATDRMLTPEERKALPFVNEFFRPIGLTETLGGHLFSDKAKFSLIGVQRGDDREQFDDDDIARLERLMPHITRALQLRRTFARIQTSNTALQAAVDRLPTGLVLLDSEGMAIFVNSTMKTIAQQTDGLSLDRTGRPLLTNLESRRRFDMLLEDVAKGGAGGIVTAPRASGGRAYALLVAPSPASLTSLTWDRAGRPGAIVLVHDPDSRPKLPGAVLEQALHLPKGAARLLATLTADGDLKSFAESEGVTIHTARFHLHTALARTGAKTQAELVRLAVRLLRDFALGEIS